MTSLQEHSTSGPQTYSPITLAYSPSQFSPHTDREDRLSKVASACARPFSIMEAGVRSRSQILCWTLAEPEAFFSIRSTQSLFSLCYRPKILNPGTPGKPPWNILT